MLSDPEMMTDRYGCREGVIRMGEKIFAYDFIDVFDSATS